MRPLLRRRHTSLLLASLFLIEKIFNLRSFLSIYRRPESRIVDRIVLAASLVRSTCCLVLLASTATIKQQVNIGARSIGYKACFSRVLAAGSGACSHLPVQVAHRMLCRRNKNSSELTVDPSHELVENSMSYHRVQCARYTLSVEL